MDGEPRIAPILFGVAHTDSLPDALHPYQSVRYEDSRAMWNLIRGMNELCVKLYGAELQRLGAAAEPTYLDESALREAFDRSYPAFVERAQRILEKGEYGANAFSNALKGAAPPITADAANQSANQNTITVFSDKLENFYKEFGAYPDASRVYFEGRQLAELFRDEEASVTEKAEDFLRFSQILEESKANLNRTEPTPQRRARIRAVKELRETLENLRYELFRR